MHYTVKTVYLFLSYCEYYLMKEKYCYLKMMLLFVNWQPWFNSLGLEYRTPWEKGEKEGVGKYGLWLVGRREIEVGEGGGGKGSTLQPRKIMLVGLCKPNWIQRDRSTVWFLQKFWILSSHNIDIFSPGIITSYYKKCIFND